MKVTIDGYNTITGTPQVIVRLMRDARLFESLTEEEYIQSVVEIAKRGFCIQLNVTGNTYAERAESLLREMEKHNMITIEE